MIIKPKFRGFICTTSHPVGCAHSVQEQINYVKQQKPIQGPKKVLVIGASTGYGLASRIVATFGSGASTLGVFLEKPASNGNTATAGWYNTAAFETAATEAGYYAKSINGDAFSDQVKEKTIALIKEELGQVDLVVYSIAAPRRTHPVSGEMFTSVIKPIGDSFTSKTVDMNSNEIVDVTLEPASEQEIRSTVAVMGGEDWERWMHLLKEAGVLAPGATTISYSYIGPKITYPIYKEGTIGRAKDHLYATSKEINKQIQDINGKAFVAVNKALVTQASAAIPVVPLYLMLLARVMGKKGLDENCIEQMYRLLASRLYDTEKLPNGEHLIRIDDYEMQDDVQAEVSALWEKVCIGEIDIIPDLEKYREEFFKLFGFGFDDVDYEEDVREDVPIVSIKS
ncbi:enoyl-ACP reductase FabV [Pelosinus baikalensis]|uniref:Trans-2-enoyl-CoA reductase [NADH] n=1 Tax=Pelosinus baikalensis TaxID=2892015 RepID=A0ABS8HL75_9FIRM|nr:enoyl-ACP reductase FabV [Pelosinus baikalensis]MCC5463894.1 trans-2-enoyl-CoA reductase family protein [Pelosinus baikalensis]